MLLQEKMDCAEQIVKFLLSLALFHLWITTLEKHLIIAKKSASVPLQQLSKIYLQPLGLFNANAAS